MKNFDQFLSKNFNWAKNIFEKKISRLLFFFKCIFVFVSHKKKIFELRKKNKIVIAFFMLNVDSWKLDFLYKTFSEDKKFKVIVVICPFLSFISKGPSFLKVELRKCEEFCNKMNYEYFIAYDFESSSGIDVKPILKPDIVFFTNPNRLTDKKLLIDNYLDTLTCYIPYSYRIDTLYEYQYDHDMVNLTWKNFYESSLHKKLAIKYARNKGRNVVDIGYPFMDSLKIRHLKSECTKNKKKKVIWAPHWTIKGFNKGLDWSCFLLYCDYIFDLAAEFESEIELIMKPHPFLAETLSLPGLWGELKTNEYFNKWNEISNCQVINGDYLDIFIESDALVHDSGSFMAEYMSLNKKIGYMLNDTPISSRFNELGGGVLRGHELIRSKEDLRKFFIEVIGDIDPLKTIREDVINMYQLNSDEFVSNKIVNHIKINIV